MKLKVVLVIITALIVGLGAGLAVGTIAANSKSKVTIADLQTKMQQTETSAEGRMRNYERVVNSLRGELQRAKMEIELLKTPPAPPAAEETLTAAAETENTITSPVENSILENAKLYTIKSGDSLWIIAQKQLGNGYRYKEILELNPNISADDNLTIGSKLKIPAK